MSTIKLRNRVTGGIATLPATVAGEPVFSVPGFTGGGPNSLWIGDGTTAIPLVDNTRQVELAGAQTITGAKTFTAPVTVGAGSTGVNLLAGDLFVMGAANGANFVAPTQVNTAFGTWATQNIGFGIDDTVTPPRLRWKANGIDLGVIASGVVGGGDFLPRDGSLPMTGTLNVMSGTNSISTVTGNLTLTTPASPGNGYNITLEAGAGANTPGNIILQGSGAVTTSGGRVSLIGGSGTSGGEIYINSGNGLAGAGAGGGITLESGVGPNGGGNISLLGGIGGGTGRGGAVQLSGGDASNADGGGISLTAGDSNTTQGGSIHLNIGTGATPGRLQIANLPVVTQTGVPTSVWNNNGVLNIGAGSAAAPVLTFGTGLTLTGTDVTLDQATQAAMGGGMMTTAALIAAGTNDTTLVSPLSLRSQLGADVTTLVTTAKTIVPAINEIWNDITALVGVVIFAGNYDATTSQGTFNGQGGITAGTAALPAAAAANHGAYVITTVAGPGGIGNEPAGAIGIGDWLLSDGAAWIKMPFSQAPLTAANIGVVPPVPAPGGTNVQLALEQIYALASAPLFFDPTTFGGDGLALATQITLDVVDGGTF